jgi:hypothetical protein
MAINITLTFPDHRSAIEALTKLYGELSGGVATLGQIREVKTTPAPTPKAAVQTEVTNPFEAAATPAPPPAKTPAAKPPVAAAAQTPAQTPAAESPQDAAGAPLPYTKLVALVGAVTSSVPDGVKAAMEVIASMGLGPDRFRGLQPETEENVTKRRQAYDLMAEAATRLGVKVPA